VTLFFSVKLHYLHFPPLLLLLPNSITLKFHASVEIILYLQIPIRANSKTTDLQPDFLYLQISLEIHTTQIIAWLIVLKYASEILIVKFQLMPVIPVGYEVKDSSSCSWIIIIFNKQTIIFFSRNQWRHWGGGPLRVTPSRGWHPNETIVAEVTKKTGQYNVGRLSCDETTAKNHFEAMTKI